jgi:hypothetical protein
MISSCTTSERFPHILRRHGHAVELLKRLVAVFIRAVWWEVIKAKLRFVFLTPSFVEVWRGGISRCQ